MDEKRFEELWEREEKQAVLGRLQREYPAWRHRRKQRRTIMATVIIAVAMISPLTFHLSPTRSYDYVACNRSGIAESHWVKVASNILTIETL